MKIAMISTPFVAVPPRDYGGTELIVHELCEGLSARGHEVTLFATGDSRSAAELRFLYPQSQWPPEALTELNHVSWALQQIDAERFEIVHVHSAAALAVARLLRDLPLVYTLHHVREETLSAYYRYFAEVYYIAISAEQARLEIPLNRLRVIHHGLQPSFYECTTRPADYVAFIGRFAEIKGPHLAMDAAARAGLRIHVAGETHSVDGEFGRREVEPRLALPHVHYLGKIGMREKAPLLRDARALLAPINWNEPFGLVLIEAMLSGCPPIVFPRGSAPELIEQGVTGFLVRDFDEMVDVIRPGGPLDGFDRLRCRARAVERFNRDRMLAQHERYYAEILSERLARARPDARAASAA